MPRLTVSARIPVIAIAATAPRSAPWAIRSAAGVLVSFGSTRPYPGPYPPSSISSRRAW